MGQFQTSEIPPLQWGKFQTNPKSPLKQIPPLQWGNFSHQKIQKFPHNNETNFKTNQIINQTKSSTSMGQNLKVTTNYL